MRDEYILSKVRDTIKSIRKIQLRPCSDNCEPDVLFAIELCQEVSSIPCFKSKRVLPEEKSFKIRFEQEYQLPIRPASDISSNSINGNFAYSETKLCRLSFAFLHDFTTENMR